MRLETNKAQGSRRPLLWICLVATLGLVYWQWAVEQSEEESTSVYEVAVSEPQRTIDIPQDKLPKTTPADNQESLVKVAVEQANTAPVVSTGWVQRNLPATKLSHALFAAHEWLPPPPKPQPPPPPQAPPLPYTYVGSMQDVPDGNTVILMQQKKVLMPKLGSQMNAQWRVDREDAQSVYFTYIPLNQAIVLSKAKTSVAGGQRQPGAETVDNIPLEQ